MRGRRCGDCLREIAADYLAIQVERPPLIPRWWAALYTCVRVFRQLMDVPAVCFFCSQKIRRVWEPDEQR